MGIALLIENELTQAGVFMIKTMFKSYSHNVQARSASSYLTLTPLAKGDQMKRTVTSDKIVIFFFVCVWTFLNIWDTIKQLTKTYSIQRSGWFQTCQY